jgi:hypothetical protein
MRKKIFCTGPTRVAKAGQKSLVPTRPAQRTTKERPLSFVLFESPFTPVSTVRRCHPSLVSHIYTAQCHTHPTPRGTKCFRTIPDRPPGQPVCWSTEMGKADLAHDGSTQREYRTARPVERCESTPAALIQDRYQTACHHAAVLVSDLVRP